MPKNKKENTNISNNNNIISALDELIQLLATKENLLNQNAKVIAQQRLELIAKSKELKKTLQKK